MGLLDQVIAGLGGAGRGAADQMSVTEQFRQRRAQLQAQREADIAERLYRQDALERQRLRDEQLAKDAAEQRNLILAAQRAQAARDAETARRNVELEKDRDRKAEDAERRTTAMFARASQGRIPRLTDFPEYAGMSNRQSRDQQEVGTIRTTLNTMPVELREGAEAKALSEQARALQARVNARSDSLAAFEDRFAGKAPKPLGGSPTPPPANDPLAPQIARIEAAYQRALARNPAAAAQMKAVRDRKIAELRASSSPAR